MKALAKLALISALSLCAGCSHQQGPRSVADIQNEIAQWKIGTDNPLLAYVPASSPIVIATQRSTNLQDPKAQAFFNRFLPLLQKEMNLNDKRVDREFAEIEDDYDNYWSCDLETELKVFDENNQVEETNFSGPEVEQQNQQYLENRERFVTGCQLKTERATELKTWRDKCWAEPSYDAALNALNAENCDAIPDSCGCQLMTFINREHDEKRSLNNVYVFEVEDRFKDKVNDIHHGLLEYASNYVMFHPETWGISENLTFDAVFYFDDGNPILKVSVNNEKSVYEVLTQNVFSSEFDQENRVEDEMTVKYKNDGSLTNLLLNVQDHVATLAIISDSTDYNKFMQPASKPVTRDVFKNAPKDAILAVDLNIANLSNLFENTPLIAKLEKDLTREFIDDSGDLDWWGDTPQERRDKLQKFYQEKGFTHLYDQVCRDEIATIFKDYLGTKAYLSLKDGGLLDYQSTWTISDELSKKLSAVTVSYPNYSQNDQTLYFAMGLDLKKSVALLSTDFMEQLFTQWKCNQIDWIVNDPDHGVKDALVELINDLHHSDMWSSISQLISVQFVVKHLARHIEESDFLIETNFSDEPKQFIEWLNDDFDIEFTNNSITASKIDHELSIYTWASDNTLRIASDKSGLDKLTGNGNSQRVLDLHIASPILDRIFDDNELHDVIKPFHVYSEVNKNVISTHYEEKNE